MLKEPTSGLVPDYIMRLWRSLQLERAGRDLRFKRVGHQLAYRGVPEEAHGGRGSLDSRSIGQQRPGC